MDTHTVDLKKKILLILVDGIGDYAIPQLGYKTPLQHLDIPYYDL